IEAVTFQFAFTMEEDGRSVSLAVANLNEPLRISSGTTVLVDEGDTFAFENLATSAGTSRYEFTSGRISFVDADSDGLPDTLLLSDAEGIVGTAAGDVLTQCTFAVTGKGGLDTTPPSIFFGKTYRHPFLGIMPCGPGLLLADSSFSICFSERVQLEGLDKLVDVIDSNGVKVSFLPSSAETFDDYAFSAMGFWRSSTILSRSSKPTEPFKFMISLSSWALRRSFFN
ncbi:MAG: hypothetical protein ACE5JL_07010, partial [Dehalococcoidia bacterium]